MEAPAHRPEEVTAMSTMNPAEAIAKATGSVAATYTVERRHLDGTLTVEEEHTHGDHERVVLPPIDEFLAARQAWKAAGCPADHPYLTDAPAQPQRPAQCLTGLIPDWAVEATRTSEVRAMLDAARDRRFG